MYDLKEKHNQRRKKMAKATAKKTNKEKALAAVESWARASLAAVAALYVSGITDPKVLLNAFLAGLLGPLVKALQPNQKDYGINSK
jgi:hypothetical protein